MGIIMVLLVALILTIIMELVTAFILGIREKQDLKVIIKANIITNPIVLFIIPFVYVFFLDSLISNVIVMLLEIFVIIVEAKIFKKQLNYNKESPLMISVVNNIASFFLWIVINLKMF